MNIVQPCYLLPSVFLMLSSLAGLARAEGDASRGEKKFIDCAACHSIEASKHGVGPSLAGLFGRKAGENPDFRFSPAMKRSGIVWSPQTLDQYIADPQKTVPANRMPYAGMPDATERADLMAYLQKVLK
jgi:cytochrome c2